MKLLAPVNSYASAELQIQSGANEIYVGLFSPYCERVSMSGRGQYTFDNRKIQVDLDEYAKILSLCHAHSVSVYVAANLQFITRGLEEILWRYIEAVNEIGFDRMIIGDLSVARIVRQRLPNAEMVASSYFTISNRSSVEFFKRLGFVRVILSEHLSLAEIESIVNADKNIEYEVFAGFGCSNYNGLCYFAHNAGESEYIGLTCMQEFEDSSGGCNYPLDTALNCALCSVSELKRIGVDSLKIVGREMPADKIADITAMYAAVIHSDGNTSARLSAVRSIPGWESDFCVTGSCKYRNAQPNGIIIA